MPDTGGGSSLAMLPLPLTAPMELKADLVLMQTKDVLESIPRRLFTSRSTQIAVKFNNTAIRSTRQPQGKRSA